MGKGVMSLVDYVVFVLVLVGSSLVGVYYAWQSKKIKTTEEYLTGGQNNGVLPVTFSLVASLISSTIVLGIPAEVYAHSIQYWMSNLGAIIGIIVTDKCFIQMFYELKLTSVNKYLLKRFDFPGLRVVSSLSFILSNVLVSGAVVYGPALAISSVTPMSLTASIVTVGIVCTFYTTVGGMKAVIWTDVLQLAVMVAGMLMVAIQGTIQAGGSENVWKIASEGNLIQVFNYKFDTVYGAPTLWETSLGMLVLWAGTFSTNQMCVQRYCSLPTLTQARICMYISIPFTAMFLGISCYCGVAIFANYYNCDPLLLGHITKPDQLMPYFVVDALGFIPGLSGLFVAAVFSGSLSTLSSALNSMTILTWDDFLKKVCKVSTRSEILITKLIAIVYGLITIGVAFVAQRMGSVLDMVLLLTGAIVGPQLGTFFLGALCPFANGKSVMISFIVGQLCCMALNIYTVIVGRPLRRLPTSIDGCPVTNFDLFNSTEAYGDQVSTMMSNYTTSTTVIPVDDDVSSLLNISPFFMPFIGWAITVACGVILSLCTGGCDMENLDPAYLSPVIRKYLKKPKVDSQYKNGVKISVITTASDNDNSKISDKSNLPSSDSNKNSKQEHYF